jgi:hypothetical protein
MLNNFFLYYDYNQSYSLKHTSSILAIALIISTLLLNKSRLFDIVTLQLRFRKQQYYGNYVHRTGRAKCGQPSCID